MVKHYSKEQWIAYIHNRLLPDVREQADDHLYTCDECLGIYMECLGAEADAGADDRAVCENATAVKQYTTTVKVNADVVYEMANATEWQEAKAMDAFTERIMAAVLDVQERVAEADAKPNPKPNPKRNENPTERIVQGGHAVGFDWRQDGWKQEQGATERSEAKTSVRKGSSVSKPINPKRKKPLYKQALFQYTVAASITVALLVSGVFEEVFRRSAELVQPTAQTKHEPLSASFVEHTVALLDTMRESESDASPKKSDSLMRDWIHR
ncbi:hypothetical protein [Brevibacillus dissolubilis]|uniref:hypothetical protein n=1 Tax=Brevibacillus dissolubilis TaxID=1844116 RepID=UPI00111609A7|nr:hypothetical protein [Brevibacillus dissolubilis]